MDHNSRNLFDVVAQGDEISLQRLLLEDKEERNIATLAVSLISSSINDFKLIISAYSTATQSFMKLLGTVSVDVSKSFAMFTRKISTRTPTKRSWVGRKIISSTE